jgi:hypothetical protein
MMGWLSYLLDLNAERLEKLRMLLLAVAIGLLVVQMGLDIDWLDWPRGLAWLCAGGVCVLEGRLARRQGRDGAADYIRAVIFALIGVMAIL